MIRRIYTQGMIWDIELQEKTLIISNRKNEYKHQLKKNYKSVDTIPFKKIIQIVAKLTGSLS